MSSAAGILYLFFFISLLFFISLALIHQLPDDAGFARYTTTATTQAYIYRYQMAFGLGGFIFSHDGHFRGIEDLFWFQMELAMSFVILYSVFVMGDLQSID